MKKKNPFILTGYVPPEHFCDREKEISLIKKYANNSMDAALFSIRRQGKTGLIQHVIHNLQQEKVKCMYLDIMMTSSINEFAYNFGKAFFNQAAALTQKALNTAAKVFQSFTPSITTDALTGNLNLELKLNKTEPVYQDLENIFQYIKDSGEKYLIAIDEFQQILDYPETNFEAFLRSQVQFIDNAAFVFSGSKKHLLLSIFSDHARPFRQSCSFMELKPIDKSKYSNFISEKFNADKREITNDSLDFIFEKTRGITYFVQLFCNYLYGSGRKKIDLKHTKDVFNIIIAERESYFVNYNELLTDTQSRLLAAIAMENGVSQPASGSFITNYKLVSSSTVLSAIKVLTDKEVVYKEEDTYFVSDPLLAEWFRRKAIIL